MRHRLLALAVFLTVPAFAAGQGATRAPNPKKSAYTPARTPWGDPDLQGVWPGTAMMGVPQERPRQFGDRQVVTDEEFAERLAQAKRQVDAANEEFAPRAPPAARPATQEGRGTGASVGCRNG